MSVCFFYMKINTPSKNRPQHGAKVDKNGVFSTITNSFFDITNSFINTSNSLINIINSFSNIIYSFSSNITILWN